MTPREALQRLRDGNLRFAADARGAEVFVGHDRRTELAAGQDPFAIILGCSDSRVPAELVEVVEAGAGRGRGRDAGGADGQAGDGDGDESEFREPHEGIVRPTESAVNNTSRTPGVGTAGAPGRATDLNCTFSVTRACDSRTITMRW